jgi:predicted deacylase
MPKSGTRPVEATSRSEVRVSRELKETRFLTAEGPAGEEVAVPVATVRGENDGPVMLVMAGCHGAEYDGIEAVKRLFQWVDPASLSGTLVTVPCLNLPAFYGMAAHVNPIDNVNPGRAFPGDRKGSYTERMVALVWDLALGADFVIDVHGGDIEEELVDYSQINLTGVEEVDRVAEALALSLDMPFFVRRPRPAELPQSGGSLHLISASNGKPAVLAEAGSHGQLDEVCVAAHFRGLRNALVHTGMISGAQSSDNPSPMLLHRFAGVAAPVDGFWYPSVKKGDVIRKGQTVGEMRDIFHQPLALVVSEENAAILGVISVVGRRKGEMLLGIGTLD